jgi:hypothetical protein
MPRQLAKANRMKLRVSMVRCLDRISLPSASASSANLSRKAAESEPKASSVLRNSRDKARGIIQVAIGNRLEDPLPGFDERIQLAFYERHGTFQLG